MSMEKGTVPLVQTSRGRFLFCVLCDSYAAGVKESYSGIFKQWATMKFAKASTAEVMKFLLLYTI
ncbi:MAG: hypothetical protein ACLR0U_14425 [Enterocloster clostridioformis]